MKKRFDISDNQYLNPETFSYGPEGPWNPTTPDLNNEWQPDLHSEVDNLQFGKFGVYDQPDTYPFAFANDISDVQEKEEQTKPSMFDEEWRKENESEEYDVTVLQVLYLLSKRYFWIDKEGKEHFNYVNEYDAQEMIKSIVTRLQTDAFIATLYKQIYEEVLEEYGIYPTEDDMLSAYVKVVGASDEVEAASEFSKIVQFEDYKKERQ